jgi:cyclopropane-fatty-acyl-phospholipid synthase
MASNAETIVGDLLAEAGIDVDGAAAADIRVHDRRFFARVLGHGSLGLGEAWMDGWWDCDALDQCIERIVATGLDRRARRSARTLLAAATHRVFNLQSRGRAFRIGTHHYDIGNDLYRRMLDRRMVYSCGYWREADDLDAAQEAKLDLICRKLGLGPGMRLLDIGCGWGSLLRFAAERYRVEGVGVTVSRRQAELARAECAGLPVDVRLCDYRDLDPRTADERFDRIASVGMVEHVGWRNYPTFMAVARRCLKPGGRFLLHTIGSNASVRGSDPWIGRYIFPNSQLPSLAQLSRAAEQRLTVDDLHSFGPDYDRTLMAWHRNFTRAWPALAERYGERFGRMWQFYLLSCAGAFRARGIQLWQLLLTRAPQPSVPETVR